MVVIVIERASLKLRGEMTRWLLETKPGVFVGNVSALVRDKLWKKICEDENELSAIIIYSAANEQGFHMEMTGDPQRRAIDMEGIQLIMNT